MFQGDKSLILAKIESVYGTDPTPTEAANAIIIYNPTFDIISNPRARNVPLAHFGRLAPVNVGEALKLAFTTEVKGGGAAGTPSRYDPLFRACGLTHVNTPATSDVYTPHSTMAGEGVTIWFYTGGVLHKLNGCAGNHKFNAKPGEVLTIDWEFTGLYADNAADVAQPAATHEAIAPIICKTLGFTYNSVAAVVKELMFDLGNNVIARKDANAANNGVARYMVSQRESKGSMKIEAEALATLNVWDIHDQTTQANIVVNPTGLSAGNDVELAVTGVVLEVPKYGAEENILTWDLSFTLNPTLAAGNNEIIYTFK